MPQRREEKKKGMKGQCSLNKLFKKYPNNVGNINVSCLVVTPRRAKVWGTGGRTDPDGNIPSGWSRAKPWGAAQPEPLLQGWGSAKGLPFTQEETSLLQKPSCLLWVKAQH